MQISDSHHRVLKTTTLKLNSTLGKRMGQLVFGLAACLLLLPASQTDAQTLTASRLNLIGGSPVASFQSSAGQHFEIVGLANKLIIENESELPIGADNVVTIFNTAREHSLVLDDGGMIGLGTETPMAMLDLRAQMGDSYVRLNPDTIMSPTIDVFEDLDPCELILETAGANKSSLLTLMAPNTEFAVLANGNNSQPKLLIKDQVTGKNAITIFSSPLNNNTLTLRDGNVGFQLANPSHPFHMRSGAHCTTGGVWTNACSRSLKDNIIELDAEKAMAAFRELQPVTYHYKTSPKENHVGFIAEDVPEIVATSDRKGLATMDLVAVLTKVVQEQDKMLETQTDELKNIKALQQDQAETINVLMDEIRMMRAELEQRN